jgi:hypothetical protein
MKQLLILSSLLFTAAPGIAGEYVYLECDNQMTAVFTEIKTGKLIKEEKKNETILLKIDPGRKRFMSHKDNSWDSAEINNGDDALTVNGQITIDFKPAGQLKLRMKSKAFGMIATDVDAIGQCSATGESTFESARLQFSES